MKLTYRDGFATFTQSDGYLGFIGYGEGTTFVAPHDFAPLRALAVRTLGRLRRTGRSVIKIRAQKGLPIDTGFVYFAESTNTLHISYEWATSSGTKFNESHVFTVGG